MATAALVLGQLLKSYRVDTFVGGLDVKTTKLRLSRLKHGNRLTQRRQYVADHRGRRHQALW